MINRTQDRRHSQALFYDAAVDRRQVEHDYRARQAVPAIPGTIRPGVGEAAPLVERRRYLDGGCE